MVEFNSAALRRTRWNEYATRFFFGGAVTVAAGIIANLWGPGIGGLFLAFPAIFPASASLIEKHERKKKERAGLNGEKRGRLVVAVETAGTVMGCVGLAVFALTTWKLLPHVPPALALLVAILAWITIAVAIWKMRKSVRKFVVHRSVNEGRIIRHEDR
jgi:hypothetical protein